MFAFLPVATSIILLANSLDLPSTSYSTIANSETSLISFIFALLTIFTFLFASNFIISSESSTSSFGKMPLLEFNIVTSAPNEL